MFDKNFIMETNELVFDVISERYIESNSGNADVISFVSSVKNDILELQKVISKPSEFNNRMEDILTLVQKIGEAADVTFEKLKLASPEDMNEEYMPWAGLWRINRGVPMHIDILNGDLDSKNSRFFKVTILKDEKSEKRISGLAASELFLQQKSTYHKGIDLREIRVNGKPYYEIRFEREVGFNKEELNNFAKKQFNSKQDRNLPS